LSGLRLEDRTITKPTEKQRGEQGIRKKLENDVDPELGRGKGRLAEIP